MRPRQHRRSWGIEHTEAGDWNLTLGNRPVVSGLTDRLKVLKQLSVRHRAGDKVIEIEPDGYRTDVTKNLIRSGWIGAPGVVPVRSHLANR